MKNLDESETIDKAINSDRHVLSGRFLDSFNENKDKIELSNESSESKAEQIKQEKFCYLSIQLSNITDSFSGKSFDGHGPKTGVRDMLSSFLIFDKQGLSKNDKVIMGEKLLELIMVHYAMTDWRIPWKPLAGFGSQSSNDSDIRKLCRFINKAIKTRKENEDC